MSDRNYSIFIINLTERKKIFYPNPNILHLRFREDVFAAEFFLCLLPNFFEMLQKQ